MPKEREHAHGDMSIDMDTLLAAVESKIADKLDTFNERQNSRLELWTVKQNHLEEMRDKEREDWERRLSVISDRFASITSRLDEVATKLDALEKGEEHRQWEDQHGGEHVERRRQVTMAERATKLIDKWTPTQLLVLALILVGGSTVSALITNRLLDQMLGAPEFQQLQNEMVDRHKSRHKDTGDPTKPVPLP